MEADDQIRNRIEAILTNEARNDAEVQRVASEEGDQCSPDPRQGNNLYLRVISTFRGALSQVNSRLEENIWFLSGFYRILENIKEQGDFQEICLRVVDSVLQEFGAEYCAISVAMNRTPAADSFIVEGISETERFVRVHSGVSLAGSEQLPLLLRAVANESPDGVVIADVYRDSRFQAVDFPSVIRSMACLSITLNKTPIGLLVLGHSYPQHFSEDHIRVLRILAGLLAHARRLTASASGSPAVRTLSTEASSPQSDRGLSLAILELQEPGPGGKLVPLEKDLVLEVKRFIARELSGEESALLYRDREILVLLPGLLSEDLPVRIGRLQQAFAQWKASQQDKSAAATMEIGYSTFGADIDLESMLEAASAVMHRQTDALSA